MRLTTVISVRAATSKFNILFIPSHVCVHTNRSQSVCESTSGSFRIIWDGKLPTKPISIHINPFRVSDLQTLHVSCGCHFWSLSSSVDVVVVFNASCGKDLSRETHDLKIEFFYYLSGDIFRTIWKAQTDGVDESGWWWWKHKFPTPQWMGDFTSICTRPSETVP